MGIFRGTRALIRLALAAAVLAVLALALESVQAQGGGAAGQGGGGGRGGAAQGGGGRGAGGGQPAGGGGGGRGPQVFGGDPILNGVIDLHTHQGPDSRGRSIDWLDEARYAKLKGMRGTVFKSHLDSTAIQAFIARKEVPA